MGILQAKILEWVAMPSSRGQKYKQQLTQPPSQGGMEPAVCIGVSSFGGGGIAHNPHLPPHRETGEAPVTSQLRPDCRDHSTPPDAHSRL